MKATVALTQQKNPSGHYTIPESMANLRQVGTQGPHSTIFIIEIPDCVSVRRPFSSFDESFSLHYGENQASSGGIPLSCQAWLPLMHSLTCLLVPALPLSLILLIKISLRNRSFSLGRLSTLKLSTLSPKKNGTSTFTLGFNSSLILLNISSVLIWKRKKKPTFVSSDTSIYIKKPMKS